MARTLEEILKTEKPHVVAGAQAKAHKILSNIEGGEAYASMGKSQGEEVNHRRDEKPASDN